MTTIDHPVCRVCGVKITAHNISYQGTRIRPQCRHCFNESIRAYNARRKTTPRVHPPKGYYTVKYVSEVTSYTKSYIWRLLSMPSNNIRSWRYGGRVYCNLEDMQRWKKDHTW